MSTLFSVSIATPDFNSIPKSTALYVPIIIAIGVARPSAQGHEITSTDIARAKLNSNVLFYNIHIIKLNIDIPITVGTKYKLTLSASLAIGAFELLATSTKSIIF